MPLTSVSEDSEVHIPMPETRGPQKPAKPPPVAPSAVQAQQLQSQTALDPSRLYRVSQLIRPPQETDSVSLDRPSQTWHRATRLIRHSLGFRGSASVVFDSSLPLQQRVDALQRLEKRLAIDPSRQYLAAAMRKRQDKSYASFGDKLLTEVYITSETVFDWFTPPRYEHHVFLTPIIIALCIIAFAYMAGAFLSYAEHAKKLTCDVPAQFYSPSGIGRFLIGDFRKNWCLNANAWQFDQGFLALWGGRYTPVMRKRWYSFVIAALVHRSTLHLVSNIILFALTAREIERRYGQLRFMLLWVNAAVGSSLFGAVTEGNCNVVVGLSGSVFGMIALYALDIWTTRKKRQILILRVSGLVLGLCALFVGYVMTPQGFSHLTHLGGVLFGILPAFLLQEHLTNNEKVEAWLPIVAGSVLSLLYIICFSTFYAHTIHKVVCASLL